MTSAAFVTVSHLRKEFRATRSLFRRHQVVRAVDDVSFQIQRGQTFGLVGESGCGKSTVARLTTGLLDKNAGVVEIGGQVLTTVGSGAAQPTLRKQIQMIFQDPYASLNPRWRVGRSIAEPLVVLGFDGVIAERVGELLTLVGLHPDDALKYPHEFSGGQRQRIAIARALASNPQFVVCDEPTSALDVSVQAQILNLMRDLQDRLGLTYLFISHNLAVIRFMATEVGVMYLGRLAEIGPVGQIFDAPRHPYTRMLLAAVPDPRQIGHTPAATTGDVPSPTDRTPGCSFHPRCNLANERCRREIPELINGVSCHAVQEGR
jgi:peptide/nickel transport system ATP-binding protein